MAINHVPLPALASENTQCRYNMSVSRIQMQYIRDG